MLIAQCGSHVGARVESGWDFLTPYVFLKNICFSYIVGVRQPCAIGAVSGSGNDELQCRPVPEESAGGFRADPEDRKRHLWGCVQGKKKKKLQTEGAWFHYRTQEKEVVDTSPS